MKRAKVHKDILFLIICIVAAICSVVIVAMVGSERVEYTAGTAREAQRVQGQEEPAQEEAQTPKKELSLLASVYVLEGTEVFHVVDDCQGMNPDLTIRYQCRRAQEMGKAPCEVCLKDYVIQEKL